MKLRLSGPDLRKIRDAIIDAYGGSQNSLALLNSAVTGYFPRRHVFSHIAIASPFDLQVADLLVAANNEGWLPGLIGALQQNQPDNEELQSVLLETFGTVSAQKVLNLSTEGVNLPDRLQADLQRVLPGRGVLLSPQTLHRRIRTVCRIDYADLSPPGFGTGFLVGPDLVLTNWHVVERVERAPENVRHDVANQLRFRFDLLERAAAEDGRGRVALAQVSDGSPLLRTSPAGGMEVRGRSGEPSMTELDYALIRLTEDVGNHPVASTALGETRGYIQLRPNMPLPTVNSALMALQHPMRGELQFAIGIALGPNQTGSRAKHTVATQEGSSGSPVLDEYLSPIAMHNGTRFGTARERQAYNTAVPLSHIVADLRNSGITEMLQD